MFSVEKIEENAFCVCGLEKNEGTSKSGVPYSMIVLYGLIPDDNVSWGFKTDSVVLSDDDFQKFMPDCGIGKSYIMGFSRAVAYVDKNGRAKSYQKLILCQEVKSSLVKDKKQ